MPPLKYVGTPAQFDTRPTQGQDLVNQGYINYLLSQNMTMTQVTNQINTALSTFATTAQAAALLAPLATPSWIQTQEANYISASQIELPNGPVALGSVTGKMDPGLINAASTQTWPHPFWSPATYNSGTVTATTTPQLLYTLSLSDPGYPYAIFATGVADCMVAADNGAYAEVFVAVGSATGPVVAQGNSVGESYPGPAPGDLSAQALLNNANGCTPGWNSVGTWVPNSGLGYSSTVISNYLQCPTTMTGTITASVPFGGANGGWQSGIGGIYQPTPVTTIEIVRLDGTNLTTMAQGPTVGGGGGTCTVSYTGSLSAGQLFTVLGIEGGIGAGFFGYSAGNYGAFIATGANLTITPSQVQMESMANIIPVPFASQTPITGPTTLYVMLASSNNSTAVSVDIDYPGLWVMPIPWAG